MIDAIKILLGENSLDDATIQATIDLASQHYMRYRPNTANDWTTSPRANSWIMEYALAYCKLLMGEATPSKTMKQRAELVTTAMTFMTSLERELMAYV